MTLPDPAEIAIASALFASVAEEMGVTLGRTAHSPNIKERADYSCAVFDARGRLIAQAAHIPVHLGAMPSAVEAAQPLAPFHPGDVVILNDPYLGGTHLPDITMVTPVFVSRTLAGFLASRAHHADVGGITPGSMPLAGELIQEGIVIPPIKLVERGRLNRAAMSILLRNMRSPEERQADLDAQRAAHRTGEQRLREITLRQGLGRTRQLMDELLDYAERMTRAMIRGLPDGDYHATDFLDDDGLTEEPVEIRVCIWVRGDDLDFDFTGSAPERPTSINAVAAVTRSAVYYVVRCLLEARLGADDVPANEGCFRPISFTLPERSVVNASPPRPVAAGNVETSQRIVDVVLAAFAEACPELIPAPSQGTMNNVAMGGWDADRGREFTYYETIGGGAGATPGTPGASAIQSHMTNTQNTPVEALEMAYPLRVTESRIRRGSGGSGRWRGGDGIVREYEFLSPASVTLLTERRRIAPPGLGGGGPGQPGRNTLKKKGQERGTNLPGKTQLTVDRGDRLKIETPGGGGHGALDS